jgi:hypothetical protein
MVGGGDDDSGGQPAMSADSARTASRYHFVRLNRYVGMDPKSLEAAIPPVRDELAPMLAAQPGCRTVFVGVDLEKGKGTVITFWTSEGDLRASDRVESRARERAVALADATMAQGLVDTYRIVLEEDVDTGADDVTYARLSRGEGVRPGHIIDAVTQFEEVDLPVLRAFPGFRGVFISANPLLGNWLGVSLWRSKEELDATVAWEGEARGRIEATSQTVPRGVIIDRYRAVLVPTLRKFHTDWSVAGDIQAADLRR